jgi:hypothetical protein
MLKKEYSCTFTPFWAFVACYRVKCAESFKDEAQAALFKDPVRTAL